MVAPRRYAAASDPVAPLGLPVAPP